MNHFHNILVGIDLGTGVQSLSGALSAANAEAAERGLGLAESCPAQLCFVSVLDAHDTTQRLVHDVRGDASNVFDEARELHHDARERILVELGDAELERPPEIRVISGSPEPAIMELIEQESIDLLIMGTIGRAGIRGVLTGNTAERLLPRLQCSMLAVKPDEFQCPVDLE